MAPPRLLGVFAHPDDEVFCAGGTLAKYAATGAETMVVSATSGQAGQIRDSEVATRRTLGAVRAAELERACGLLGVTRALCLDYVDGTLGDLDLDLIVKSVAGVLAEFEPDVVITFGDDGAYGHPDHVAMSRATTRAFTDAYGDAGPQRLYHSHFPRSRLLLLDHLAAWLLELGTRFRGESDFVRALSLFAEESTTMRFADDAVRTIWAPTGFYLVEQGEPATSLYLILSGEVEVLQEQADGSSRSLRRMGPGEFFGELGVAERNVRSASVVARQPVTCFVFSEAAPTLFQGRGQDVRLLAAHAATGNDSPSAATTVIDVTAFVDRKIAAIAAHRSQYPIEPSMFPAKLLREMLGREHFTRLVPAIEPESDLFG